MDFKRKALRIVLTFLVVLSMWPPAAGVESEETGDADRVDLPPVIRIAVPYYDDASSAYNEYYKLFSRQLNSAGQPFSFSLVVGTYDQILHWYQSNLVDLAILPPGAVADLLTMRDADERKLAQKRLEDLYIGSRVLVPTGREEFIQAADAGRRRVNYKAVALVAKEYENGKELPPRITDFHDLIAKADQVKLLFVHPLSVSGRILPEFLFQKWEAELGGNKIEWTYSHKHSLKRLKEKDQFDSRIKVAFIWDALTLSPSSAQDRELSRANFHTFSLPDDSTLIPQEILVATPKFDSAYSTGTVRKLLRVEDVGGSQEFVKLNDWMNHYRELKGWVQEIKSKRQQHRWNDLASPSITLEQIGARLRNYSDIHGHPGSKNPLRLAVVLSGGGAKCAYQLGVIEAVELELKKLRDEGADVDIDLVVGTSGGAVNALPVALGITREEGGRQTLYGMWNALDQTNLVRLWGTIHVGMGAWFALSLALSLVFASLLMREHIELWWKAAGLSILILALALFLINGLGWTPWALLGRTGQNHHLRHFWLVVSLNLWWSASFLILIGAGLLCAGWLLSRRNIALHDYHRKVVAALLLLLAATQCFLLVAQQRAGTLVSSSGYEQAIVESFSRLLREDIEADIGADAFGRKSTPDKIKYLSQHMVSRPLLKRDLVITGSALSVVGQDDAVYRGASASDPGDLYFFFQRQPESAGPAKVWPLDKRFVSLSEKDNRLLLLDAVIGSGSIYPLFPARRLQCVRRSPTDECREIQLIDGGFIHNSPLEAAIRLGATHIIVIEASPFEAPMDGGGLLGNSLTAFNYLFSQAQNLDAQMYGQREIFIIRPNPAREWDDPNLDTFDFSEPFIKGAIDKGLNDALDVGTPRFFKVQGQPTI